MPSLCSGLHGAELEGEKCPRNESPGRGTGWPTRPLLLLPPGGMESSTHTASSALPGHGTHQKLAETTLIKLLEGLERRKQRTPVLVSDF